jgi:hypothetical protein
MAVGVGRRYFGISSHRTKSSHNNKIPTIDPTEYLFIAHLLTKGKGRGAEDNDAKSQITNSKFQTSSKGQLPNDPNVLFWNFGD